MKTRLPFALIIILLIISISCNTRQTTPDGGGPATSVVHPGWIDNAVMYEVNVRQYTPEGTFNAFADKIPLLKELGVNILWLMPIHPIGEVNRKGTLGSYYSVRDYKGINPEFGTMEDFKELVRKTHEAGMYLIIDWVPNHSSWDNDLIQQHPEWYEKDSLGNMFSPWDWTDVVQFDYDQPGLRAYMIETLKFWLTETGLDGFRFDVAHQVPVDFWNDVRPALQSANPDVLLLAEAEQRILHEHSMDISYGWELHHILNQVAQGKATVTEIDAYFSRAEKEYHPHDIRLYFTSNHDENSWNGTEWERMGEATEVMTVLTYVIPGMPLIYSGQEAGSSKRLEFFEKDEIEWNNHPFRDLYNDLNQLKKQNPALWNPGFGGDFTRIPTNSDSQALAFVRELNNNQVVAVLNLSPDQATVRLDQVRLKGSFTNFFTGESLTLSNQTLQLDPWSYKVFTK
ncbi:MAG: alpha-amylase family glycosyl hydrolase [Bacteroidales bacterium]